MALTEEAALNLPARWWQHPDLLASEVARLGSNRAVASEHGISETVVRKWRRIHGLGPSTSRGAATPDHAKRAAAADANDDGWLLAALKKLGDQATVEQLADETDSAPRRVRDALGRLGRGGYRIAETDSHVRLDRVPTETGDHHRATAALFDGDHVRFAVVSDIHLGSRAERLDWLDAAYDVIHAEGVRVVYNPGDLVDGLGVYRTQNTEVLQHTYEEQVAHAAASYPMRAGVITMIIGGNHDLEGDFGKAGADPVLAVCNQRADIEYLGRYSAWVDLPNGATLHMLHPMGGASYAMSYRPQKIIESYEGGEKPNVLLIGHWHRGGYFFSRSIHALLAGTFQGPTTYSTRKAFGAPGYGFWIVDCRMADDGSVVRFRPEWFPFYPGRAV